VVTCLDNMASDVSELAASGPFISEVLRCRLYVSVGIAACTAMINPSRDALNQLAQATHATALCLNSIRHRLVYDIIAADDPEQMPRLTPDSPLITDALELARASTLGKSPRWDRLAIYMYGILNSFNTWLQRTDPLAQLLYIVAESRHDNALNRTALGEYRNAMSHARLQRLH